MVLQLLSKKLKTPTLLVAALARRHQKFYSVDHGMGHQPFCGETCLDPKKYKLYHLFEKNLTKATEYPTHPCMHQFDTKGGHYSVYTKTVTHGVPGLLSVTLDLWGEGR